MWLIDPAFGRAVTLVNGGEKQLARSLCVILCGGEVRDRACWLKSLMVVYFDCRLKLFSAQRSLQFRRHQQSSFWKELFKMEVSRKFCAGTRLHGRWQS